MYKRCILIPARGGSKGIPKKNLFKILDKPLIFYPIRAAHESKIDEVFVTTDCDKIAEIAAEFGAKIINRPKEISGDLSTDLEAFQHFVESSSIEYDYIVHLRATFPKITGEIVDDACDKFEEMYESCDSMRSVIQVKQNPYKMWHMRENFLYPVVRENKLHSAPRQLIESSYLQNACVDIVKTTAVINKNSMIGDRCLAYQMSDYYDFDIDTIEDIQGRHW